MNAELQNPSVNKFISSIYLDDDVADVHFTFPDDDPSAKIPAVKAILAAASPAFKAMFFGPLKESKTVKIAESTSSAFKEFLQLFYLPRIKLTMDNLKEVIRLADMYDMLACFKDSAEFLVHKLTSENMTCGYQLAILLNDSELKEFCEQKIQKFIKDVLKSESFLQCERTIFENILALAKLNCTEVELFDACIAWAKSSCQKNGLNENDSKNLKDELGPCFYLIRFGWMTGEEICKILSDQIHKNLFNQDELIEIMQMLHMKNFQSRMFSSEPRLTFSNGSNDLICRRNGGVVFWNTKTITWGASKEWTWFSVSEPILLKQFQLKIPIFDGNQSNRANEVARWNAELKIVEYKTNKFVHVSNVPSKILHLQSFSVGVANNTNNTVSLPEPILIDPRSIYAIILTPSTFQTKIHCQYTPWNTEYHFNGQITVKFHSPDLYVGIVSCLVFNQIDWKSRY